MSRLAHAGRVATVLMVGGLVLLAGAVKGAAQSKLPTAPGALPKVDLNTASLDQLQKLPGINADTAQKIIGGRPYTSIIELEKVDLSKPTIDTLAPMITVGDAGQKAASPETVAKVPPQKGMVWVNTESGLYFHEGAQ